MQGLDFYYLYISGAFQFFAGFFFFTKCLHRKINPIFTAAFTIAGTIALSWTTNSRIQMGGYLLFLVAAGFCLYKEKGTKVLLYALVTVEITQLNYGIANAIFSMLVPFLLRNTSLFYVVLVAFDLLPLLVSVACYYAAFQYFLQVGKEEKNGDTLMLLAPVFMIFLVGSYINFCIYGNTVIVEKGRFVSDNHNLELLFIQLLGIAGLFGILFSYKKLVENFRLNMEYSILTQQEGFLRQYVREAEARYEKTKSLRHDMKNHITVVRELLQKNNTKEALIYIGGLDTRSDELSFPCSTNNPVLDILLGNKLHIAENEGIEVSCGLHIPKPCAVSDIDFCIILSNALDNAISACRNMDKYSRKHIAVIGKMQGDFLLLEIENSFCGNPFFEWGTGLYNIRFAAEKYHGTIEIETEENIFVLRVLLGI